MPRTLTSVPSKRPRLARLVGIALATVLRSAAAAEPAKTIAVFDFEFVNTSLQNTTPEEEDRIRRLSDSLRSALENSSRYRVVGTEGVRAAARTMRSLRDCGGCELPVAREAGAELAAYGWIQKVSNLILNINLVIEDAATGRHIVAGSVDIRGNNDESWAHGLRFMMRERVLHE